jgi:hypothetical protein
MERRTFLKQVSAIAAASGDWGEIVARKQGDHWILRLENEKIRLSYGRTDFGDIVEDQIVELVLKSTGENQAGKQFDEMGYGDHEGRGLITDARIVADNEQMKKVRIEWDHGKSIQEVVMFRDSALLRMEYVKFGYCVADIPSPGGGKGKYVIHGAEKFGRPLVLYPQIYYNRYPGDVGKQNITGIDRPGSLDYRGWMIAGIYNESNSRGYARVMPTAYVDGIKLLQNRGYEFLMRTRKTPFTGFVYLIDKGAEEILSTGKHVAERHRPADDRSRI